MSTIQLKECGKVFISTDYRLVVCECFYCNSIYTEWLGFLEHVKSKHGEQELHHGKQMGDSEIKDEHQQNLNKIRGLMVEDGSAKEPNIELIVENLELIATGCKPKLIAAEQFNGDEFLELANESEILSFIEIIKKHPCLWTSKSNSLLDEQNRNKSLKEIHNLLEIPIKDIAETLDYLINWFNLEYNNFKQCRNNNTTFTSKYPKYFVKCKFLTLTKAEEFSHIQEKKCTAHTNNFKCPHCEKMFSKKKYLTLHIRRHIKDLSYKCDFCDKRTVNSTDMKTHMRVHTGEKPYVCERCGKSFKTCSVLNAHIRKHDKPKFQCTLCSKSYFNSTDLKNHTNVHLDKRDYKCKFCAKAFTSAKLVYSHIMNSHSTLRKSFCKICQKCFPNIVYHRTTLHGVDAKIK